MSNEERKISMNVNGESKVPPGFRFHPTEEELLQYYLRKKVASESIDLDVIQDVDLNKLEPWDIQVKCNIGSTPQNDWYFFSHKDKKYPTGTRTNRATIAGFWKATGRDKAIHSGRQTIGMRKTLVFYQGRAPHGQKSDWIMHEYRLDDIIQDSNVSNLCDGAHEEGWVVCRVFKKKNYHKSFESPRRSLLCGSMVDTTTREKLQSSSSNKDALLEQLLMYMDSSGTHQSFKQEITDNLTTSTDPDAMQQFVNPMNDMHLHLPRLGSPTITTTSPPPVVSSATFNQESSLKTFNSMMDLLGEADEYTSNHIDSTNKVDDYDHCSKNNWADLDKFVASQLDGQMEENKHCSSFYAEHHDKLCFAVDIHDEQDVWSSLARSSALSSALMADPLCHFSV